MQGPYVERTIFTPASGDTTAGAPTAGETAASVLTAGVRLRKLTPYDRAELLRREKQRQRDSLVQSLRDAAADKAEIIGTLREFDAESWEAGDFLRVFDSVSGKADLFDLAACDMTMAGPGRPAWAYRPDAEQVRGYVATLKLKEEVELAAELCGITLGQQEEPDAAGAAADEAYDPVEAPHPTPGDPEGSPGVETGAAGGAR